MVRRATKDLLQARVPPASYARIDQAQRWMRGYLKLVRSVPHTRMRGGHAAFVRAYGSVRARQASFRNGDALPLIRRLDAELLVGVGLDHLRGGRLRDGAKVFERASALAPGNQRARRFRDQARSDLEVLSGRWAAPNLPAPRPFEPVPGRVLHVVGKSLPYENGYTLRTRAIVASQRAAGLDPHITTDDRFVQVVDGPSIQGTESIDGTPHHRILPVGVRAVGMSERLATRVALGEAVVQHVRPSVLHAASDFMNAEAALVWGRRFGIPTVYEVRGFWAETWLSGDRGVDASMSDTYLGRRARERACMMAADAVVTLGEAMKVNIVEQGIDPDKVVVVPNAVDVDRFQPGARNAALAASLGIEARDVVVGYITSMTPYEGIHHLVEAIAELRRRGRPVKGLLVGDGVTRSSLEDAARRLRLSDHLLFTGWVDNTDIADYYRLIDVFVVPRVDARVCQLVTPLKPFEAMASGCTVVASDLFALREIVRDGETGMLVPAGRTSDLVEVLATLVDDAGRRAGLAQRAQAWVAAHRTWTYSAAQYMELYGQLGAL